MTITRIGVAVGTAFAGFAVVMVAVPAANAGGVYWNNNAGGGAVVNCGYDGRAGCIGY